MGSDEPWNPPEEPDKHRSEPARHLATNDGRSVSPSPVREHSPERVYRQQEQP